MQEYVILPKKIHGVHIVLDRVVNYVKIMIVNIVLKDHLLVMKEVNIGLLKMKRSQDKFLKIQIRNIFLVVTHVYTIFLQLWHI